MPYQQTDPCHSINCTTQQIFGVYSPNNEAPKAPYDKESMRGFLKSYDEPTGGNGVSVMDQFSRDALPILTTLAQEFALFDGWFASVPGPTQPNRAYAASATSNGMTLNNQTTLAKGTPQKTMQAASGNGFRLPCVLSGCPGHPDVSRFARKYTV